MSFFTHDQMIKAVQRLHPQFVHGRHYLVLMGIEPDGSPASDAWIEQWHSAVPVPSMQSLREAYAAALEDEANQPPPPPPAPPVSETPLQFFDRFTEAEQLAIVTATMAVPQIKLWYDKLIAATEVVFADPRLASGMDAMVSAGLITQARSEEILPLNQRSYGVPSL